MKRASLLRTGAAERNANHVTRRTLVFETLESKTLLASVSGFEVPVMIVTDQLCYPARSAELDDLSLEGEGQAAQVAARMDAADVVNNNPVRIFLRNDASSKRFVVDATPAESADDSENVAEDPVAELSTNAQMVNRSAVNSADTRTPFDGSQADELSQQRFSLVTQTMTEQVADQADMSRPNENVAQRTMIIIRVTRRGSRELDARIDTPVSESAVMSEDDGDVSRDEPSRVLPDDSNQTPNILQLEANSGSSRRADGTTVLDDATSSETSRGDSSQNPSQQQPARRLGPMNVSLSSGDRAAQDSALDSGASVSNGAMQSSNDTPTDIAEPIGPGRSWMLASQTDQGSKSPISVADASSAGIRDLSNEADRSDNAASTDDTAKPGRNGAEQPLGERNLLAFFKSMPLDDMIESSSTWADQVDAALTPGLRAIG